MTEDQLPHHEFKNRLDSRHLRLVVENFFSVIEQYQQMLSA